MWTLSLLFRFLPLQLLHQVLMSFLMMMINLLLSISLPEDILNLLCLDHLLLVLLDVFIFRSYNKLELSSKFNLNMILLIDWFNRLYFSRLIENYSHLSIKCLLIVLRFLVYKMLVFIDSLLILFLITMLIEVKLSVVFWISLIDFILFLLIVISILLLVVLLQQLLCLLDFIIILLFWIVFLNIIRLL